jgi:hypothetical protein
MDGADVEVAYDGRGDGAAAAGLVLGLSGLLVAALGVGVAERCAEGISVNRRLGGGDRRLDGSAVETELGLLDGRLEGAVS